MVEHYQACRGMPFPPQNCPFPQGYQDPYLTHGSLGPPNSASQTASQLVQPFCTAHSRQFLYFTLSTNFPFSCGSGPLSNTWFPGPTRVLNPNGNSSSSFGGLTTVTDRQTVLLGL